MSLKLKNDASQLFENKIETGYSGGKMGKSLAIAYNMKKKMAKPKDNESAMMEDHKDLGQKPVMDHDSLKDDIVDRIMKRLSSDESGEARLAEGGEIDDISSPDPNHSDITFDTDDDSAAGVASGLSKALSYSKGGEVADEDSNQFDDLVLDDHLESDNSGSDDGDELGDEQEDEDRKDIVSRIMKSSKKKDKNPRPA